MELSQVVLFGLVLPEPERPMEPWLREVDKALGDEEIVETVMTIVRRRWQQSARRGRAGTPAEVVLRTLARMGSHRQQLGCDRKVPRRGPLSLALSPLRGARGPER
jgi:hypothetical protein